MALENESLQFCIQHVFWLRQLPQEQSEHLSRFESSLLVRFIEATNLLIERHPEFKREVWSSNLQATLQLWHEVDSSNYSSQGIRSCIKQMNVGTVLALYLRAQNACLLIERRQGSFVFSTFEVSFDAEKVTEADGHLSCGFPGPAVSIPDGTVLSPSSTFLTELSEHVATLSKNMFDDAIPKSHKASTRTNELRDVTNPKYVTQWLLCALSGYGTIEEDVTRVTKTIRDDVLWDNCYLPNRRSPQWTVIKVVLHLFLVRNLGLRRGTTAYKLILVHFMTSMLSQVATNTTDVPFQMMQKISNRLRKVQLNTDDQSRSLVDVVTRYALDEVGKTRERLNRAWKDVQEREKHKISFDFHRVDFERDTVIEIQPLEQYLTGTKTLQTAGTSKQQSVPPYQYDNEFLIWEFVDWDSIDDPIKISTKLQTYIECMSHRAKRDPESMSSMILTALTVWMRMDRLLCEKYPILKQHAPGIDMSNCNRLLLPYRSQMCQLQKIEEYIAERMKQAQYAHSIYCNISSIDSQSFPVRFYRQSKEMQTVMQEIVKHAKEEREQTRRKLREARDRIAHLKAAVSHKSCSCEYDYRYRHKIECDRCKTLDEAKNISVSVHEWPLPGDEHDWNNYEAEAVVFELQMPSDLVRLRDVLHLIRGLNSKKEKNQSNSSVQMLVCGYAPLNRWYKGTQQLTTLGSVEKSFGQAHYRAHRVSSSSDSEFFKPNGLRYRLVNKKQKSLLIVSPEYEVISLKIKKDDPRSCLQWTVYHTSHTENDVLASQNQCPQELSIAEYVDFGTLRAGHRIQWRNILSALESRSIALSSQGCLALFSQAAWQTGEGDASNWCRQAHMDIHDDSLFSKRVIKALRDVIENVSDNWSKQHLIHMIITLSCRVLELSNDEEAKSDAAQLILYCRELVQQWIQCIDRVLSKLGANDLKSMAELRRNMALLAACGILTFSAVNQKDSSLIYRESDARVWITLMMRFHDDLAMSDDAVRSLPRWERNVVWSVKKVALRIKLGRSVISTLNQNCQLLEEFVRETWSDAVDGTFGSWTNDDDDTRFHATFTKNDGSSVQIMVDTRSGQFLIDGAPISRLPRSVITHPIYKRAFHPSLIFEVQPAASGGFVTVHSYHDATLCFQLIRDDLSVVERWQGKEYRLIPHKLLHGYLPDHFIDDFSHWWDESESRLQFRPIDRSIFDDPIIKFTWHLVDGTLTETDSSRKLLSIQSQSFAVLVLGCLDRIESTGKIHVFVDQHQHTTVAELPRLGIKFSVALTENRLYSIEYAGMFVAEEQSIGTLIGLQSGLLVTNGHQQRLLIPNGTVERSSCPHHHHQRVAIRTDSLRSPTVFVYDIDTDLQQLKSDTANLGASFMLALLHGSTSHFLCDPFLGMTGHQRACQLLQSPLCTSNRPLEPTLEGLLEDIANLAPNRAYYPKNMRKMQQIAWPSSIHATVASDAYCLLVDQIICEANSLYFLFSDDEPETPEFQKELEMSLTKKGYWRNWMMDRNRVMNRLEATIGGRPSSQVYAPRHRLGIESLNIDIAQLSQCIRHSDTLYLDAYHSTFSLLGSRTVRDRIVGDNVQSWYQLHPIENWTAIYRYFVGATRSQDRTLFLLTFLLFRCDNCLPLVRILAIISAHREQFATTSSFQPQYELAEGYSFKESLVCDKLEEHIYEKKSSKRWAAENECSQIANRMYQRWQQGPASSIEYVPSSSIDVYSAIQELRSHVQHWYVNHHLREFLMSVDRRAQALSSTNRRTPHGRTIDFSYQEPSTCVKIQDSFKSLSLTSFVVGNSYDIGPRCVPRFVPDRTETDDTVFRIYTEENPCSIAQAYQEDLVESYAALRCQSTVRGWEAVDLDATSESTMRDSLNKVKEQMEDIERALHKAWFTPLDSIQHLLMLADLWPNVSRRVLLEQLNPSHPCPLVTDSRVLSAIRALGVLITQKQRLQRCLHFKAINDVTNLKKELHNIGHQNWDPANYPEWLLLEIEGQFMIREIQAKVALEMMKPSSDTGNSVLQLNMGEGKTSVIVPLLAASLANGRTLVRIVVLKPLLSVVQESLQSKLGGILNRRVRMLPFHRGIHLNANHLSTMCSVYGNCTRNRSVLITLPEYLLSFKLMGLEQARRDQGSSARAFIQIQEWLDQNTRDILDESDEILHFKYQLTYTVGSQKPLHGGELRWTVVQSVLKLLSIHAPRIWRAYGDDVEYENSCTAPGSFSHFRFISDNVLPYQELCESIMRDVLDRRHCSSISIEDCPSQHHNLVIGFTTREEVSAREIEQVIDLFGEDTSSYQTILILRGMLACKTLFFAFSKRWRVNYGVSSHGRRRMAVPFKAKDVASERTEFGHPDVAILLTQISYYYSGLTMEQLEEVFEILHHQSTPHLEYARWIEGIAREDIPHGIRELGGVNLADPVQKRSKLLPFLSKNRNVIDFWLSSCVFPNESKQFQSKLVASGWDLAKVKNHPTKGFSGTNDTRLVLPLTIQQCDLDELKDTNATVVNHLLRSSAKNYRSLKPNISGRELLSTIGERILLDVGALMMELDNEQTASTWLQLSPDSVEAAVYFNDDNQLVIRDRNNRVQPFTTSPFRGRLQHCVVYLDDAHCRGTDLKFPLDARAAVTLGRGVTKDKLVQACMRMRLLGHGQSVQFYAAHDVDRQIPNKTTEDVIRWAYENSRLATEEGFMLFATQGTSFYRRADVLNRRQTLSLTDVGDGCTENDAMSLMEMYGREMHSETIGDIMHRQRCLMLDHVYNQPTFLQATDTVIDHCKRYVSHLTRFANLMDEEQERELETEKEDERQVERPPPAKPLRPSLSLQLSNLMNSNMDDEVPFNNDAGLRPVGEDLRNTSLDGHFESNAWSKHLYCTRDFTRVVESVRGQCEDNFLRPVRYVAVTNRNMVLLSAFEANELLPYFRCSGIRARLHMFLPRKRPNQSTLFNDASVVLPPIQPTPSTTEPLPLTLPLLHQQQQQHLQSLLTQLSVFAGSAYFETEEERDGVCAFLGLCLAPRTREQQEAFDGRLISPSGFVSADSRHLLTAGVLSAGSATRSATTLAGTARCHFVRDPVPFLREYVPLRSRNDEIVSSHLGMIIVRAMKPTIETMESGKSAGMNEV